MRGALALTGSGEYLPVMQGLEQSLLHNAVALESRREKWRVNPLRGLLHVKNTPLLTRTA
jgi:hypothetical protein